MDYIKIELTKGISLRGFDPAQNGGFDWATFGSSAKAIQLDDIVVTGQTEADGDYVYLLPIETAQLATKAKEYLGAFSQIKAVTLLTRTEAEAVANAIKTYQASLA